MQRSLIAFGRLDLAARELPPARLPAAWRALRNQHFH
jgi:hypothetical protein